MSWIRSYREEEADPSVRRQFERVCGPGGQIDNILRLHGLRPHTLGGHMALYKAVLHHTSNRLEAELLEALGVYASLLNDCDYCVRHHAEGMRRACGDQARADRVLAGIDELIGGDERERVLEPRWEAALAYAERLTMEPARIGETDIDELRRVGFDDGEILEINQVVSYFAYANRTVLGLGATAEGEELGYHPETSGDLDEWAHR